MNSTPQGAAVATEYKVRKWRQHAVGYLGANKKISFPKFAAWVYDTRLRIDPRTNATIGQRELMRQREARGVGRDVIIPPVLDPERKESCRFDLHLFMMTYFPGPFKKPFSEDHHKIIGKVQTAILQGRLFAVAAPRGFGKTAILRVAVWWGICYGHIRYCPFVASDGKKAKKELKNMQRLAETSRTFEEDFPGIVKPIRACEAVAQRAKTLTVDRQPIYFSYSADEVVLPWLPDEDFRGAILECYGITGGIRGISKVDPEGTIIRPDFVIIDDPQTKKSAKSEEETKDRTEVINEDIMGLAEPGEPFGGVALVTVIYADDVADQLVDRERSPAWQGERLKFVTSWPEDEGKWSKYQQLRRQALRDEQPNTIETEYYRENREDMDRGFVVSWEHRFDSRNEISAQQHAYNRIVRMGKAGFDKEYQNEPAVKQEEVELLDTGHVTQCIADYDKGQVPPDAEFLVMAVDVQKRWLYWEVAGFETANQTSWSVDFGIVEILPDGTKKTEPTKADLMAALNGVHDGEDVVEEGVLDIAEKYMVKSVWIDAGYKHPGSMTRHLIRDWAHSFPDVHAVVGRGHANMPKYEGKIVKYPRYKPPGREEMIHARWQKDRTILWFFDADALKVDYHTRLRLERHAPGCCYVPREVGISRGSNGGFWYARHMVAEQLVLKWDDKKGKEVGEWVAGKGRHDMLDVRMMLYGAAYLESAGFTDRRR